MPINICCCFPLRQNDDDDNEDINLNLNINCTNACCQKQQSNARRGEDFASNLLQRTISRLIRRYSSTRSSRKDTLQESSAMVEKPTGLQSTPIREETISATEICGSKNGLSAPS